MLANPPRYQIPTHLGTPDKIDLPLFGITISLTIRQGVCFLLGGSVAFHFWQQSFHQAGMSGLLAHWVIPCGLAFATYVLAIHTIHGRHLEDWALILAFYLSRPKVFVWRSVLEESMSVRTDEEESEETDRLVTTVMNEEEEQ
jgi:hypothetical protein